MAEHKTYLASVGIRRCCSGWHGFIQDQADVAADLYLWQGPHRATDVEAMQDAWNEGQQRAKEAEELTGERPVIIPAFQVN